MSLAELQAAFAQLPADDRDAFCLWLGDYQMTQREAGYDEWFRAKVDQGLRAADEGRSMTIAEARQRLGLPPR